MKKVLLRSLLGVLLVFAALLLVGGYLLLSNTPSLSEPPEAPVLGMPPLASSSISPQPYTGPHPSVMQRPPETFSFPIRPGETGPAQPLFAGEKQYPFLCGKDNSRDWIEGDDVQPLPDNDSVYGVPIFAVHEGRRDSETIIGYSQDCSFPTHVRYYYKRVGEDAFYPLEEAGDDIDTLLVNGQSTDFVVRLETGTINRFFYAIAVLRGEGETAEQPSGTYWNKRLVYQMGGGVGVGRRQGNFSTRDILRDRYEQLRAGYAIVTSTANETRNHYNIWLAEDTARRVKQQFISLYGEPLYTVGIGGSGGAIQQYLFAQNSPGLIDAAIPLYAYPDMITQTIHVMDCELLEYYFEVTDADNPDWKVWENRSWIEGMSANSQADNRFGGLKLAHDLLRGRLGGIRSSLRGSSECVNGWRGLTPLVYNPRFADFMVDFAPEIAASVQWSHWDDLRDFYGLDEHGFANTTWDNVGVQYGLDALRRGQITMDTFLDLNARVGSWKPQHQMQQEQFWFLTGSFFPPRLNLMSQHNMNLSPVDGARAAPRHSGSLEAMQAAYRSGHVFVGLADIPIVDLRHYLDPELDMHHSSASFSARARMIRAQGHADNQLIWMTERPHDPQVEAFAVIDEWMANILADSRRDVLAARPEHAQDRCYSAQGDLLASGTTVWDGAWNARPEGACMQVYPAWSTSREVAGGGPEADVFKCYRRSIADAVDSGIYEGIDLEGAFEQLQEIFPEGVCDYRLGDAAWPENLLEESSE